MWFFICGQTHLISILSPRSRLSRVLCATVDIIYLLILAAALINQFRQFSESSEIISTFITNSVTLITLFPNFVATIENWVRSKELELILNDIEESLDYFGTFVNTQARITDFVQHYYKQIFFVTFYLSLNLIIPLIIPTDLVEFHLIILLSIAGFYEQIAFIHIAFYVNLQSLILNALNDAINPVLRNSLNECVVPSLSTEDAMLTVHRTKIIYQKIWKISENLNERFGYFLVVGLMSTGVFLVQTAMELFILLNNFNYIDSLRE